jgi:hypothetical protein
MRYVHAITAWDDANRAWIAGMVNDLKVQLQRRILPGPANRGGEAGRIVPRLENLAFYTISAYCIQRFW